VIVNNKTRRDVMLIAWDFRRADAGRSFADCLRGAWRWVRRMAADTKVFMAKVRGARRIDFSPSLIRSPIANATSGQRFGRWADHKAAHMTARLGY
jgi:hypothetical protein